MTLWLLKPLRVPDPQRLSEWRIWINNGKNYLALILSLACIWALLMHFCPGAKPLVQITHLSASSNSLTPTEHLTDRSEISPSFPRPDYFPGQISSSLQPVRVCAIFQGNSELPKAWHVAHRNLVALIFSPEDGALISAFLNVSFLQDIFHICFTTQL